MPFAPAHASCPRRSGPLQVSLRHSRWHCNPLLLLLSSMGGRDLAWRADLAQACCERIAGSVKTLSSAAPTPPPTSWSLLAQGGKVGCLYALALSKLTGIK